jgi:hypothetical protein
VVRAQQCEPRGRNRRLTLSQSSEVPANLEIY